MSWIATQVCLDKQPNRPEVAARLISSHDCKIQVWIDGGTFPCGPADGGEQLRGDDAPPGVDVRISIPCVKFVILLIPFCHGAGWHLRLESNLDENRR